MPVVAGGRMYQFGYYGTTEDLKKHWYVLIRVQGKFYGKDAQ